MRLSFVTASESLPIIVILLDMYIFSTLACPNEYVCPSLKDTKKACKNGGDYHTIYYRCNDLDAKHKFFCVCTAGFEGKCCDSEKDLCGKGGMAKKCKNGATCKHGL